MNKWFWSLIVVPAVAMGQVIAVQPSFTVDTALSSRLQAMVSTLGLDGDFDVGEDGIEQISLAVIDLDASSPRLAGVHFDNFIYPASVYKMYVAAEVLEQISDGRLSLWAPYVVHSPNDVDRTKELAYDPRPLLHDGDTVNINYLLDLMITRSDNSAANCLIDIAQRENINALIDRYHWQGSEVTRKFLKRQYEDSGYATIRGTETCALHAADFMARVFTNRLVNPWVSQEVKALLARQMDTSKCAAGLPRNVMFYHKTGWYAYWTNDVGIVDDGSVHYVLSCFVPLEESAAGPKMKELSRRIYEMMKSRR